ncbi:hypothetical protein [Cytobacillus solani]|uniref:Holliday junction resolvase RuvC n=1 Tax=Cytobacillus solani TaxID=1637975 RepID=A0A0Q3TB12_9BACI|nr:hypothetical protein [Cytobacillus solani]KQL20477.1 hypothetical protein AN957_19065 [Cytobacillus solani]
MRFVGIDPSTKTGLVIIDKSEIWSKEITTTIENDPERFMDITKQVISPICESDVICIEGFSYGSKGAGVSTQYGIGWLIRAELIRNGYSYYEVSPSSLKKFATGKGNAAKDAMVLPIYKHWGFDHPSDNVRDAFVLAKMAQGLKGLSTLTKYQIEALEKVSV